MKIWWKIVIASVCISIILVWQLTQTAYSVKLPDSISDRFQRLNPFPPIVSLRELVERPRKFNHQKVQTVGFVELEFEAQTIYLSYSDYEQRNRNNSLWLADTHKAIGDDFRKFDGKNCIVEGIIDCDRHGHLSAYKASLTSISRMKIIVPKH